MRTDYSVEINNINITYPSKDINNTIKDYKNDNPVIANALLDPNFCRDSWSNTKERESEKATHIEQTLMALGLYYNALNLITAVKINRGHYACVALRTESIVKLSMLTDHHSFWEYFKIVFDVNGASGQIILGAALNNIDDFYDNLPWLLTANYVEYSLPDAMWQLNNDSDHDGTVCVSDLKNKIIAEIKYISPVSSFKLLPMDDEALKEISWEEEGYTAKIITDFEMYVNYLVNYITPQEGMSGVRTPWSKTPPSNSVYIIVYEKDNEPKLICHLSLFYERCGWHKIDKSDETLSMVRKLGGRIGALRQSRKLAEVFLDE